MAMAHEWIDAIFTKLSLLYGARFRSMYNGHEVEQIRADWAHELDGIGGEAVNHALHNMPADHPPNVLQFKALCMQHRPAMRSQIPAPRQGRMTPEVKAKLAQVLAGLRAHPTDPLAGARSLRAKERNGVLLTRAQKEFWRTALAREMREEKSRDEA